MRTVSFCLLALAAAAVALEPLKQYDGERSGRKTRYPSPDGRYSMLITYAEEPGKARAEIIELRTQRVVALVSDPEDFTARWDDTELKWSPDSRRVAAYTGSRRGGSTRLFVRMGNDLKEVTLPELPELPKNPSPAMMKKHNWKFIKVDTVYDLSLIRWLDNGGAILELSNLWAGTSGMLGWTYELTLHIDAKGKVRLAGVKKSEVFEEN